MTTRVTRLRRLRIRRAIGRLVIATCVLAATMLWIDVQGRASSAEGQTPPAVQGSPVAQDTPAQDVGVWAVQGSQAPQGDGDTEDGTVGQRIRTVRVAVKGKDRDVTTNATTVRQLLAAMGIEPDRNDRVTPPPSTPLHRFSRKSTLTFTDIDVRRVERKRPVAPATDTVYTTQLNPGEVKITRDGRPGKAVVTLRREFHDGRLVRSKQVKEKVLKKPVSRVREVGKAAPQPVASPVSGGSGGSGGGGGSGGQSGTATWYQRSCMCAAHPTLPFGTVVKVTASNGKSVTVVINDRGPYGGAIIDLSDDAFAQLAPLSSGVINVRISW